MNPTRLPTVTITARRGETNDEVSLLVDGRRWFGWTDARITRGIERLPSDFQVSLTEFVPAERPIEIPLGAQVQVLIGEDAVLTGYVDRIMRGMDARSHTVTITGRSKCADLVDCAAEWPGGQIVGSNVLAIAKKLAAPYGIEVTGIGDMGPAIPQFNLMRGESPYTIIERLCRFGQLLAYDDPDGDLVLTGVSKLHTASGFREGLNVQRAYFSAAMDGRFSETKCFIQSVATLSDTGEGGDLQADIIDDSVPRHRGRVIVSGMSGKVGQEIAKSTALWSVARAFGRGNQIKITSDSWRDSKDVVYAPNRLALVELPSLRLPAALLTISEVTYHFGPGGTQCDLTLMPPEAFQPQPFNVASLLPFAELADVAAKYRAKKAAETKK